MSGYVLSLGLTIVAGVIVYVLTRQMWLVGVTGLIGGTAYARGTTR